MIAGTLEIQMLANMARLQQDMDAAKRTVGAAMTEVERAVNRAKSVLATLGFGVSMGSIVLWQKAIIDAADSMNDMTQRLGMNIRQLATWQLAAAQSGTSMESVAKGVKGLSGYMTEHSARLKTAGITATDTNGAMVQLADLFVAMPDGIQKTNLAVQLFGKAGLELIPLLNLGSAGLAEAQEKAAAYAARLEKLAPLAAEFNEQMEELALQSRLAGMNITAYFVPGMIGLSTWLNDVLAGGQRMETAFAWASEKSPLFAGLLKWHNLMNGGSKGGWSGAGSAWDQNKPVDEQAVMAQFVSNIAIADKREAALKRANQLLNPETVDAYKAVKKHADDYIATLQKETAQVGLDVIQKKMLEASLEAVKLKTVAERTALMAVALAWADATRKDMEAATAKKFIAEAIASATKALEEHATALGREVADAERALELYGLTGSEIQAVTIARLEENMAREQARDADEATLAYYEKEIAARKRIRSAMAEIEVRDANKKAAEDAAREWQQVSDQLGQALTNDLMRGGKSGLDYLKSYASTLVLRPLIQAAMSPLSDAVGSAFGGGGGALGTLSNLSSLSGMYNAFATSGVGTAVGLSTAAVPGLMGPTLTGGALGGATLTSAGTAGAGAMGAVGAAVPWIAAAVLAYEVFAKKGGGPQQGQYGSAGAGGYTSSFTMSGGDVLGNQALSAGVMSQIAALAAAAGKSAADISIGQGYKLDPQGTAAALAYRNITVGGRKISGGNFDGNNGADYYTAHDDGKGVANFLGTLHTSELQALITALADPQLIAASNALMANYGELEKSLPAFLTAQAMQKDMARAMMTDAERLTDATETMRAGFAALGIAVPESSAAFRELIQGINITTQAGMDELTALNKLGPAFLEVADATVTLKDSIDSVLQGLQTKTTDLEIQLQQAMGNELMAFFMAYTRDTAGMNEAQKAQYDYNLGLVHQIDLLNDATAAANAAAQAEAQTVSTRINWQDRLSVLTGAATQDEISLRNDLAGTTDAQTQELIRQVYAQQKLVAAQAEQQRAQEAASRVAEQAAAEQRRIAEQLAAEQERAAKQVRDSWQHAADGIFETMRKLRGDLGSPGGNFAQAQADFAIAVASAKAGSQDAANTLPALARAVSDLSRGASPTMYDQQLITARTLASLQSVLDGMGQYGITVPRFATGANFIPTNMLAHLDAGERVIPAADNRELMSRLRDPQTNSAAVVAELKELRRELVGAREELKEIKMAAMHLDDVTDRWDGEGLPEERT